MGSNATHWPQVKRPQVLSRAQADNILVGEGGRRNMEPSELERFRTLLTRMLGDAARRPVNSEDIVVEAVADAVDHSQRVADRDLAIHQIESNFNRTQNIKLALERIADGSYGTCLMCEQDISPKRLQAVPWAAYCVRCQEMADEARREPESERLHPMRHKDVA